MVVPPTVTAGPGVQNTMMMIARKDECSCCVAAFGAQIVIFQPILTLLCGDVGAIGWPSASQEPYGFIFCHVGLRLGQIHWCYCKLGIEHGTKNP